MQNIQIDDKTLTLDIGAELTVKDLRKIQPVLANRKQWEEIEFAISIIKALSVDAEKNEETMNSMTYNQFISLSEKIAELLDFEKKTKA